MPLFFIYPTSDLCECPFTIFRSIPCKGGMVLWRPSIYFRRVGRGRAVNQLGYDEINSWTERAKEKNSRLEDQIASYMYICVFLPPRLTLYQLGQVKHDPYHFEHTTVQYSIVQKVIKYSVKNTYSLRIVLRIFFNFT